MIHSRVRKWDTTMQRVEWIIENRVILLQGHGEVTVEVIQQGMATFKTMVEEGTAPIYVVNDGRYVKRYPMKIGLLKDLVSMGDDDKIEQVIRVGGDNVSKFIAQLLIQFTGGKKPIHTKTVEEAMDYLLKLDDSLPREYAYEEDTRLSSS